MERDYCFGFFLRHFIFFWFLVLIWWVAHGLVKANSTHTIGVEFGSKLVDIGDRPVKLQVWFRFFLFLMKGIQLDKRGSGLKYYFES